MKIDAIVTIPPYADFIGEVAAHPLVSGLRLNTVMPLRESHTEVLQRLSRFGKPVWIDLKGRQLRVVQTAIPPFTEVLLSHSIRVPTPVDAFFSDGNEAARILAVDGKRIILEDSPHRLIGPGESVNIIHPQLEIEGTLTETDLSYLKAMRSTGLCKVMLSFVESPADIMELKSILPDAEILLKIESLKGVSFARKHKNSLGRLMAARGDLYVEVVRPHRIVGALRDIIQADPRAIVASRIFDSLAASPIPYAADIGDVAFLLSIGYRTFMLGDTTCMRRETVLEALNLLDSVGRQFI
ncbi:MAG: hypothetical protein CVU39_17655 [Chloroflexi bacterium HGW-Chloroflexi-10]|nr:MAG: hypothetical protein CVU39_17655 [Chloroflexi bacterium HGW-Chloroflexi-10]